MAWSTVPTFSAGGVFTAAQANTLGGNLKAIGDPWTAYTPTWTGATSNPTLGNGTLTAAYMLAGKFCWYKIALTIGSSTALGTGTWSFTLPPSVTCGDATFTAVGASSYFDTSASNYYGGAVLLATSTTFQAADGTSGTRTGPSAPFVWATGDKLGLVGFFEAV